MFTRRQLIRTGTVGGAALLVPTAFSARQPAYAAPVPGGTLDPARIPKYVMPLFVLPAMPGGRMTGGIELHQIAARQFNQRILPPGLPTTPVFGYGRIGDPSTFHFPSFTIEARVNRTTRVRWANQLVTPGGNSRRDMRPQFTRTPGPYRGPVPFVTHLHGAHSFEEYDGYPEAWYLPVARDIPGGFARVGSFYERF